MGELEGMDLDAAPIIKKKAPTAVEEEVDEEAELAKMMMA